jgi:hypothetical protein
MNRVTRAAMLLGSAAFAGIVAVSGVSFAGTNNEAPVTPATTIHGLPGNNAGFSDQANGACPATNGNADCDGGIHNIASNPGQSGNSPQDRDTPPACDMHGGLNQGYNKNC